MKILVILAHPKPGSFNHAIGDVVCQNLKELGHEPIFHDLYAEKFDPVLPLEELNAPDELLPELVLKHSAEITESQGMIFIHPNWWGGPPAILRGWIDRVVRAGFAYRFSADGTVPMFTGKTVQIFSTSNTPRDYEINVYKDPIEHFWKVIVFGLCGCKSYERRNFEQIILSTEDERHAWLQETAEIVKRRFQG